MNRTGARQGGKGVVEGAVYNHGVDPQLQISEILVILMQVACSENLRLPMVADGREICLWYISKG